MNRRLWDDTETVPLSAEKEKDDPEDDEGDPLAPGFRRPETAETALDAPLTRSLPDGFEHVALK